MATTDTSETPLGLPLADFSVEAIGLHSFRVLRDFARMEISAGANGDTVGSPHWVAMLVDMCPRYKFERHFLPCSYDYSDADSRGDRGVIARYTLQSGPIYEAQYLTSRRSSVRKFIAVHNGEIVDVAPEQALAAVTHRDYARLCRPLLEEETKLEKVAALPPAKRPTRRGLGFSVLDAARQRVSWTFDNFPKVYLSFSAGKDSTVMLHLAAAEARKRGRKFGLLLIDLEAQYKATIEHAEAMYRLYDDCIEAYWIAIPMSLRNAVSMHQPQWRCWDENKRESWVRTPPPRAHTDGWMFDFFSPGMEFEDFVEHFGKWYGRGQLTACMVGIRTDESLNRWRAIARDHARFRGKAWTTRKAGAVVNIYPIYDWKTEDIWTYHAVTGDPYNPIYDLMSRAGLSIHQMRICQPYGDDQRKGLWLYHILEPETWPKIVARVEGANSGALHARDTGNMTGVGKITLPEGHTWQSFARSLLDAMPPHAREHYENKIAVFLKWYEDRGYSRGIPDESDREEEAAKKAPSWRRICKALLRNDWWCKGLSFSQHKSDSYERYLKVIKKRRQEWGL